MILPMLMSVLFLPRTFAAPPAAEEFRIRIDTVAVSPEDADEEELTRSMELVARPGKPFSGRVVFGASTLMMSGRLVPSADTPGAWQVDVRYVHKVDTGDRIPIARNRWEPVIDTSETETTVVVRPGEEVFLGGFETLREQPGGKRVKLIERNVLVLMPCEKN